MGGGEAATAELRPQPPAAARSASFVRETRFALAPHVFACAHDSHVVLLDLERDEYYALDASVTRGVSALVDGWPRAKDAGWPCKDEPDCRDKHTLLVAESLAMQGLIVSSAGGAQRTERPAIPRAERDLQVVPVRVARMRTHDLWQVSRAVLTAAALLRCCSLQRAVRRAMMRKCRRRGTAVDQGQLMNLVGRFQRLCPLFFSASGACLLESLALLEFLARNGVYADWIFGVRTRPFAAHCWVQHGAVVCNDALERICRFTPILVA